MSGSNPSEDTTGVASTSKALPKKYTQLINMVRAHMRDFEELNRLTEGVESSDRQIAFALLEAVDDFNTTPPLIADATLANFPSISLLMRGAVIFLLEGIGLLQTRNNLSYYDGTGVQVNVSNKTPMLLQWLGLYTNQYEARKRRLKQAQNLGAAFNNSGVSSEYAYLSGFYDEE